MNPRAALRAACAGLAIALTACTSPGGNASSAGGEPAGQPGVVIAVGSFDFPESVLLAEIYGQALAADKSRCGSCRTWARARWWIRR